MISLYCIKSSTVCTTEALEIKGAANSVYTKNSSAEYGVRFRSVWAVKECMGAV